MPLSIHLKKKQMSESPIINVQALQFAYSANDLVLQDLNLNVPPASIYGFLGANGAGKTTTIRTILGLLQPTNGQVQLFGKSLQEDRSKLLSKIGALIESPSLYLHLSGYENLKIACQYFNIPYKRIEEVLAMVQLEKVGSKLTKKYSTGMKQRLGLAIALLNDPDLLILDEPINGLDPNGIIQIRQIIQELYQSGKPIFLSSHLLSEVEKIATHVGVIHNGKMRFEGTIEKVNQLKQGQKVHIRTNDVDRAVPVLKEQYSLRILEDRLIEIDISSEELVPSIINLLITNNIKLYEVKLVASDLEQLFVDLVG